MPRRPREVIEGAVYHLYNRFARGEPIFASADDAERFVARVRQARDRGGLPVLAWCLMWPHDHLAVWVGPVPLARSMGVLQPRFAADLNRRRRSSGPLWQRRYKATMASDEQRLLQLIAYVRENPVRGPGQGWDQGPSLRASPVARPGGLGTGPRGGGTPALRLDAARGAAGLPVDAGGSRQANWRASSGGGPRWSPGGRARPQRCGGPTPALPGATTSWMWRWRRPPSTANNNRQKCWAWHRNEMAPK